MSPKSFARFLLKDDSDDLLSRLKEAVGEIKESILIREKEYRIGKDTPYSKDYLEGLVSGYKLSLSYLYNLVPQAFEEVKE
jgi:hypothetical protein